MIIKFSRGASQGRELYVGDGETPGGILISKEAL